MDSFIFLARLCPSLPIIWKLFWLVVWPVWLLWWWIAEGAFRCSLYLSPKVPIEAQCLFRDWERLQLRASDYKNHRIFTLRCLHKDLVPVSIKLKTNLTTSKARQIIRKAEKDLLQARVKAINNTLDQVAKQTEECRTQLASIISAERASLTR